MKRLTPIFIFVLLIFIIISCKDELKEINISNLPGDWEILAAKRNGNSTNTLDNAFMKFENGNMTHNLNGDTITNVYKLDENTVILNDDLLKELKITKLVSDTLEINTKISNMRFNFLLKRNENN